MLRCTSCTNEADIEGQDLCSHCSLEDLQEEHMNEQQQMAELRRIEREDIAYERLHSHDSENADVDVEVCTICGGYYSSHSKEKEFARKFPGQVAMQRCFTCWDL